MVCSRPLRKSSRCRTSAGRRLAVRKSEFGNNTRTTSPRRVFIVDGSLRAIPVFGEGLQTGAKVGGLRLVDATSRQIDGGVYGLWLSQHRPKLGFQGFDSCLEFQRPLPLA